MRVYDAASSRSNEDDARHEVSRSLSVSDLECVIVSHMCKKDRREIFEKRETFSFERKGTNFIYLRKLEKSIHTLKGLCFFF